jgi:hypothetical protein
MAGEVDMNPRVEDIRNWMPIRIYRRETSHLIDWCYMGGERFTDPFFDITVTRLFRDPFNLVFRHQTPIEFLGEVAGEDRGLSPAGFIFHMSRCGSTLAAQMFASLEQNIVLSEPSPVDSVLRANALNPAVTDEQRSTWLRWLLMAFGRKRTDAEKHYFIKFDSWTTLEMGLILEAFPDVPWVFLYRDPLEVLVSQMNQRGAQMIPGAIGQLLPGFGLADIMQMQPEEYCARVLAAFCETALRHSDDRRGLLVNYTQMPGAVTSLICEHFNVSYSGDDLVKMHTAGGFNSKAPQRNFTPDSKAKRESAGETVKNMADKWANPIYERLEAARLAK